MYTTMVFMLKYMFFNVFFNIFLKK